VITNGAGQEIRRKVRRNHQSAERGRKRELFHFLPEAGGSGIKNKLIPHYILFFIISPDSTKEFLSKICRALTTSVYLIRMPCELPVGIVQFIDVLHDYPLCVAKRKKHQKESQQ
jgi:hypothetical protein